MGLQGAWRALASAGRPCPSSDCLPNPSMEWGQVPPLGSVPVADAPGAPAACRLQPLAYPLAAGLLCQLPLGDGCHGCLYDGAAVGVGVSDEHGSGWLVDLLSIEPRRWLSCPHCATRRTGRGCWGRCVKVTHSSDRTPPYAQPLPLWRTTGSAILGCCRGSGSELRFSLVWGWLLANCRRDGGWCQPPLGSQPVVPLRTE